MTEKGRYKIGILGGMGPLATHLFYGMLIQHTEAKCDQDHIDMIVLNHASVPDRTEAILSGGEEQLFDVLMADCRHLEECGVSHIVIPCNTSHFLFPRLQAGLSIPIIDMIRSAAEDVLALKGPGAKVGILATRGTIHMGLYQKALAEKGLIPVVPSGQAQEIVMRIIYDGIKNGQAMDFDCFKQVAGELLEADCNCALMACTELSWFRRAEKLDANYFLDAMEFLAKRTVLAAGKNYKE